MLRYVYVLAIGFGIILTINKWDHLYNIDSLIWWMNDLVKINLFVVVVSFRIEKGFSFAISKRNYSNLKKKSITFWTNKLKSKKMKNKVEHIRQKVRKKSSVYEVIEQGWFLFSMNCIKWITFSVFGIVLS